MQGVEPHAETAIDDGVECQEKSYRPRFAIEQAKSDFEISNVGIVHRLGKLEIGETSVVISVAAPHRKSAFGACEWLIQELKRTVPIWKKEIYADGAEWVEGESY